MAVRTEVIQDASARLGDLELGTLTGGVDSTHPVDTGRTEPDGHWSDAWMTIRGIERRVTDYIRPGLFVTNAFPFVPSLGDQYELRKDQLHTRAQVLAFCNSAIRDVQLTTWVRMDSYLDALQDPLPVATLDTTAYPVPDQMECVYGVLYQMQSGTNDPNWYPISHNDWFVNEPEMVTLYDYFIPDQSRVRLLGTRRPNEMLAETSQCEVEPSFVATYAAKLMSLRMMRGADGDRMKTLYAALKQEEDVLRRTMRLRQPNNVRRVRPTGTAATPGNIVINPLDSRAAQWFTGPNPPTYLIGRPGDFYLQGDGTVWENKPPWTATGTDLTGPAGDVDAAILEYDQPDQPLDVVP